MTKLDRIVTRLRGHARRAATRCRRRTRAARPARARPAARPAPTGLVVGSGNFYSPIVANLEQAVAFYRDGIGFEVRGEPTNADANPQLMTMFGLPDAAFASRSRVQRRRRAASRSSSFHGLAVNWSLGEFTSPAP